MTVLVEATWFAQDSPTTGLSATASHRAVSGASIRVSSVYCRAGVSVLGVPSGGVGLAPRSMMGPSTIRDEGEFIFTQERYGLIDNRFPQTMPIFLH
ncbi:unnamed protein product [Prunus armeniaca]